MNPTRVVLFELLAQGCSLFTLKLQVRVSKQWQSEQLGWLKYEVYKEARRPSELLCVTDSVQQQSRTTWYQNESRSVGMVSVFAASSSR